MMLNTNCCCDKPTPCNYDIALLITEEKVSVNAPILETPSVSFYIQEFLGFSGGTLNQYINAGPIEGQKENTTLYKELYENLTGKTFDGVEGCCKDPNYYFLDHSTIKMSSPKYLGTHHKDEKQIFYEGNSNSNEKHLHSLVKQTLILPNKFKDYDHPGLTLFSQVANLGKIQTELSQEARVKSLLKHAFSYFFKSPNTTNKSIYNNYYKSIDDQVGDDSEQIGYYYNAIINWNNTVNIFRESDKTKLQPKIKSYYVDHPTTRNRPFCTYGTSCPPEYCGSESFNYAIPLPGTPIIGIAEAAPNGSGPFILKEVNFDRASHGISYYHESVPFSAWDYQYVLEKEKIEIPIYNKIPVYFPPADLKEKNIGYTLSVQFTDNLPVFSGVDEDFLIHYTGLTLGFVNSISPITYKFDTSALIKNIKLSKKLISIGQISGITLQYKYSGLKNFNTNKFSSDTISYLRYLNKADMINDEEIERLKANYYRQREEYIRVKTVDKIFNKMQYGTYSGQHWNAKILWGWPYETYGKFERTQLFQFCSIDFDQCETYPPYELKYIKDFSYENSTNLTERSLTESGGDYLYNFFYNRYTYDYAVRITPYFINFNYFNNETQGYNPNTINPTERKVNQNINDYFHHGVYFDLNKTFQLKKLWETHLSYFWGPLSGNNIEPTLEDTEGTEHRYLKYVYPVVSVNKELCQTKSAPKAWSVYFTVHNDVIPNNNFFEQYFFLNDNEDSYVKTKTLLSKYQENIKLSVKVLRILKDTAPYELQGVTYSDKDKKRIKFIDSEYAVSDNLNEQQEINNNHVGMDEYEFLQPIHQQSNKKYNSSLIQNKNLKIKEDDNTNNVIVFEDSLPNNTFFDKEQNERNFSANLNDNITLAPWSRDNKNPDPKEIGLKMAINVAGIPSDKKTDTNITKPFYIGRTFSTYGWDYFGNKDYYNYNYGTHDTLLANINLRRKELFGRELNLPLITNYVGEKTSGKQIVIPYLKFTRNTSVTFTKNDTEWKRYTGGGDYFQPTGLYSYCPTEKHGTRSLQAEYNIDILDTSVGNLNPFLLYEPPIISEYNKSGYGLYKQLLYSHLEYRNIKESDLFEEWKNETVAYLQYDYNNLGPLCLNINCLDIIEKLERSVDISNKLYFINPICRKNNFNFDVKAGFSGESYIRNYSGVLDNYKIGGVYGPENGTSPYTNSMLYAHEHVDSYRTLSPKPAINKIGTEFPPLVSGYHYRNAIQNLTNLVYKNIDIGANNNTSGVYPVKQRIINTNIETIPLEVNLYHNRNQEMYIHFDWTWFFYEYNARYSNYYYYTNTSPLEVDLRRSLKLIYDATSMNSNYANIDLFKKVTSSTDYYFLLSTDNTSQPIAQIDGKKHFESNEIISKYITKKIDGNLSINENLTYCGQYCHQNEFNHPSCDQCNLWLYGLDPNFSKTYWYPHNMGGFVLDTDTYAFKYDYTQTKSPKIEFMIWHTGIDFGQFSNDLFNLRNSYVSLNNETHKDGWLIKKNQPDQFFVDNLLESIQEKYIEFQYFEEFILAAIDTVDSLTDTELYCLTVGKQDSKKFTGKEINNTRPFERKLSFSGYDNNGDVLTLENNTDLFTSLGRFTYPVPACSTFQRTINYGSPPLPNLYVGSTTYTTNWLSPIRTVTTQNLEIIRGTYNDGKRYYTVRHYKYPGQPLPTVKRTFYYLNETGNLQSADITNSYTINQTVETVNIPRIIPPKYEDEGLYTRKLTTIDNLISGTFNWYNNVFKGTNRLTMKEALISNLNNLLEEKRKPFVLLEQLFGTINLTTDIVNEKNLKQMSTKVSLQNHYNLTRLEKIKSITSNCTIPRFFGSDFEVINYTTRISENNYSMIQLMNIKDFIYIKDESLLPYKTSNECWPNIKSIDVYSPNLGKIKYNTISDQPHFLKGLMVSQSENGTNSQFNFHTRLNNLNTFTDNENDILNNTNILNYNFYRDEGYYLDLSKDYEVYMPQMPMSFTYDALPSFDKITGELPYTVVWSWGSIPTGTVEGPNIENPGNMKLEYVYPKEIVYTNLKSSFDLTAFTPESKNTIKNTFYKMELFSHGTGPLYTYTDIITTTPPTLITWNKPQQFILTVPFDRIELVVGSTDSTKNIQYKPFRREIGSYQYEDAEIILGAVTNTPELGEDRVCYDGDCEKYNPLTSINAQQAAQLEGTYFRKYPAFYNMLSAYDTFILQYGHYLRTTPFDEYNNYESQIENKLSYGDVFNCLATIKFATTRTHSSYVERIYPERAPVRDYASVSPSFWGNLDAVNWTNYVTFIRPKIKVKGIPIEDLKLIDFSSIFKNKQIINDILYPLYGNFAKK